MKFFIHFDKRALKQLAEARVKAEKEPVDDLSIAIAAVKAAGLKPVRRQPLMMIHKVLIGMADFDKVEALRQIPNVRKVSRADGKKMNED